MHNLSDQTVMDRLQEGLVAMSNIILLHSKIDQAKYYA